MEQTLLFSRGTSSTNFVSVLALTALKDFQYFSSNDLEHLSDLIWSQFIFDLISLSIIGPLAEIST